VVAAFPLVQPVCGPPVNRIKLALREGRREWLRRDAQSCQFKYKEVIIGKLEPRMDANEREFLMSYKNS
jgi:hypothetical protein